MSTVLDSELFADANRVKGKVVLITGAANGIGKAAALYFGQHGANVVIGDLDVKGAKQVISQIKVTGGGGIAMKCDVTSWDQQLSLFQLAMNKYGQVDIVVPNAGMTETNSFSDVRGSAVNGVPTKPNLKTIEVDLIGVIYTTRLALYYLLKNSKKDAMKSLIFIGSMSSMEGIPGGVLYSASKHGLVGLMGSLYGELRDQIRFGIVCPWFADTAIVPIALKLFMAGLPLTPLERIGGTIFRAATDPDPETNGAVYTLPDGGEAFRINRPQLHLDEGVYRLINARAKYGLVAVMRGRIIAATIKDVIRVLGPKALVLGLTIAAAVGLWKNVNVIRSFVTGVSPTVNA